MKHLKTLLVAGAVAAALSGCSMFNTLTGQTDNTVLPGQREDAIPGRTNFPEKADVPTEPSAGQPQQSAGGEAKCSPDDPACKPASGSNVYSDPQ